MTGEAAVASELHGLVCLLCGDRLGTTVHTVEVVNRSRGLVMLWCYSDAGGVRLGTDVSRDARFAPV